MQRIIAIVLIATLCAPVVLLGQNAPNVVPTATQLRTGAADSYNRGVMDAEDNHSSLGWGVGGFLAGGLFSWLGTGIVVLVANGSTPSPRYMPDEVEPTSYRRGFRDEAVRRNRRSAAIPGIIMSTIWTIAVLNAANAQ